MTLPAVAIICPVLRRPHRVVSFVESVEAATSGPHSVIFVATEDDVAEVSAIRAAGLDPLILPGQRQAGDYSRKINYGYRHSDEPLLLLAGDDLRFTPGWHEAVAAKAAEGFGVIGTQDLGSPRVLAGIHSTHPVVTRWYADQHGTIDNPGQVVAEHYGHVFVDDELIETAKSRGMWAFADDAVLEHCHPSWGKATADEIYALGRSTWDADKRTYQTRRVLWT